MACAFSVREFREACDRFLRENGVTADFQLLVGENEKVGNEGPTSYYFFVELG